MILLYKLIVILNLIFSTFFNYLGCICTILMIRNVKLILEMGK